MCIRQPNHMMGQNPTRREGERPRVPSLCNQPPSTALRAALGIQPNRVFELSEGMWVECRPENVVLPSKAQRRLGRSLALP